MAKKPVHLAAAGKLTPRDRLWEFIRKQPTFTLDSLHRALCKAGFDRIEKQLVYHYVEKLREAGYLESPGGAFTMPHGKSKSDCGRTYKLVRDIGALAPVLREPSFQGRVQAQMWRTMRIYKTFNVLALAEGASIDEVKVSVGHAKVYCNYLARAGYLHTERCPGKATLYHFVPSKFTGPKAPQVQRTYSVYDPNLGEVVYHPGGEQ
jgi:hypothetical protein